MALAPSRYLKRLLGSTFLLVLVVVLLASHFIQGQGKAPAPKPVPHTTTVTPPPVPDALDFAGEAVPTTDPEVRERLEHEILANAFSEMSTLLMIKRSGRWQDSISTILKAEGVPLDFYYLMVAESALRTRATSYVGAQGLWQFMPRTAREYGLFVSPYVDERNDPEKATRAACAYLKNAYRTFGSWTLAAASYNRGIGGIRGNMRQQQVRDFYSLHLNEETSRYILRIVAIKLILENPVLYGFHVKEDQKYKALPTRTVEVEGAVDWPSFARAQGTTYKMVRWLNPWINASRMPAYPGRRFQVKLPAQSRPGTLPPGAAPTEAPA